MIWELSGVWIFNFEHIQHFDLVFWLLAKSMLLPSQQLYLEPYQKFVMDAFC